MLWILSPAKNMRTCARIAPETTAPRFLAQAEELWQELHRLAPYEIESLMGVSPALALKTCHDLSAWQPAGGVPAVFSYDGLAYKNLDAATLTDADLVFAQAHLRILSALYGVLRPLDAIWPYRLEMAHKPGGQPLYAFWGDRLAQVLFQTGEPVINLASKEYSRAVSAHLPPDAQWISCEFLTYRRGKLRQIATLAKMARGQMARYLIRERIDCPEGLAQFAWEGFSYEPALSNSSVFAFVQQN